MKICKIISSLLLIFCLLGVVSCSNETTSPNIKEEIVISFDLDGGSMSTDKLIIKKGNSVGNIEIPVKEGYSFSGWYYDCEFTKKFEYTDKLNENITLYASFVKEISFIEINLIVNKIIYQNNSNKLLEYMFAFFKYSMLYY